MCPSPVKSFSQFPLLLHHLQLQPLHAVPQRLFPLLHRPRAQLFFAAQWPPSPLASAAAIVFILWSRHDPTLLELRPRLQRLNPAILPLELRIGAGQEEGDVGADFIAEGGFGGGEGGLGDELVVLRAGEPS